jgi:hypothetical protein
MKAEQNSLLGGIVSIVGALMGIVGHFFLFQTWYFRGMAAESAEPAADPAEVYSSCLTDLAFSAACCSQSPLTDSSPGGHGPSSCQ